MDVAELREWCAERGACSGAMAWLETRAGTAAEAWADCNRVDWLMWLAGRAGVDRRRLVAAAAACARSVVCLNADPRVEAAVAIAERYVRGEDVSAGEAWAAADAAAARAAADAAAARAAADAAARAAWAAWAAARAAAAAARAAANAANAAANAAAWAAGAGADTATIVRTHITWADVEAAMGASDAAR